jgi:hypothetical protein
MKEGGARIADDTQKDELRSHLPSLLAVTYGLVHWLLVRWRRVALRSPSQLSAVIRGEHGKVWDHLRLLLEFNAIVDETTGLQLLLKFMVLLDDALLDFIVMQVVLIDKILSRPTCGGNHEFMKSGAKQKLLY